MFHLDSNFNFHIIDSAPSPNVAKLEMCLKKLREIQNKYADDSAPVVSLLNLIADLACVERSLLFDDIENMLGAIAEVNFSVKKAVSDVNQVKRQKAQRLEPHAGKSEVDEEETISLQEYHHRLVTQLVNTELCDLPNAIKITQEQPFKDIEGYLSARIRFLNRDPQKEQQEKAGKELMQELVDGSFFGETKPDGSDGFRDGVFAAMGMKPPAPKNEVASSEETSEACDDRDDSEMPDSVKQALGL